MADEPVVDGGGTDTPTVVDVPQAESAPYDWHSDIHEDVKADKVWESVPDVKTLTKAYADAVKYNVGALKLPKEDAPPEEWGKVWEKLGRPAAPEGYTIPASIDTPTLQELKNVAHVAGISGKQWDTLMAGYSRTVEVEIASRQEAARVTTEALQSEWGAAHPRKLGMVQQLIKRYGDDEVFAEYNRSGAGNHLPTIRMFARIAQDLQDEKFLDADVEGIPSREAALAEIETLTSGSAYLNAKDPAHKSTVAKVTKLFELAYN